MTRGTILRRLGAAYLWCLLIPVGTLLGGWSASRALRDLARYDESLDLRGTRRGVRAVMLTSLVALGLLRVDPVLGLAACALVVATGDAVTIEYSNAMRSWRTIGGDAVRARWARAEVATCVATATLLACAVGAAESIDGGGIEVAGQTIAPAGTLGAGLLAAVVATRLVALFVVQSAHVLTRDLIRQATVIDERWEPTQPAIAEPPASS